MPAITNSFPTILTKKKNAFSTFSKHNEGYVLFPICYCLTHMSEQKVFQQAFVAVTSNK